jgi:hypothetical protein
MPSKSQQEHADPMRMKAPTTNWTCPNCGCYNPPELKACMCGGTTAPVPAVAAAPAPPAPRRRLPTWIAALPALILPTYYMINATRQLNHASQAIGANRSFAPISKASGCVDTYGITLSNSHEYVRTFGEASFPATRDPNAPRELATVMHGNVINTCGDPLTNVHLKITVRDERGSKGTGTVQIQELKPGISQQFERAWMASVVSWEIASDK